jgi:hypothetical protein
MGIEVEVLKNHTDFSPESCDIRLCIIQGKTINNDFTFMDGFKGINCTDKGALTAPARTTNDDNLALGNLHGYIFQDMERPKPFIYIIETNHARFRISPVRRAKACLIVYITYMKEYAFFNRYLRIYANNRDYPSETA